MKLTVAGREVSAATGGRPFDPSLPAVLFVHGAGADHTVWALQTRYFAHRGHAVLAVDLPGHGGSEGPALVTVEDIADWLVAVLDAASVGSATLVGHSMGAVAVLECAARQPERVTALALLGTAPSMPVHPDLLSAAAANDRLAHELITDWSLGRRSHLGGSTPPGLWMAGGTEALLDANRPGVLSIDLQASAGYDGAAAAAALIRCPTLVLLADDDRMTPRRFGEQLARTIDGARLVVVPGSGHSLMTEQPDATLDALKWLLT